MIEKSRVADKALYQRTVEALAINFYSVSTNTPFVKAKRWWKIATPQQRQTWLDLGESKLLENGT